jgi:predicted  nucleic acid-binding Zn-ribbon protein
MVSVPTEQLGRLVQLQKLEIELQKQENILKQVDQRVAALDANLNESVTAIESKDAATKELQQRYRSWESEVQDNVLRIQKSEEKLRSVKTNKEYQSGLKEIEDLKAKSASIEDKMIQCLEELEAAEEALRNVKTDYEEQRLQLNREKEAILAEAGRTREIQTKLQADKEGLGSQISKNLLQMFNRVKVQQPDGLAIVQVVGAVCNGCHMNIPPQMYNELQREDSLKMCPSCERIIYWQRTEERSE